MRTANRAASEKASKFRHFTQGADFDICDWPLAGSSGSCYAEARGGMLQEE
jgi:hypothetical protein